MTSRICKMGSSEFVQHLGRTPSWKYVCLIHIKVHKNNIEMDLSPIIYEGKRCLELARDRDQKQVLVLSERNF
jgi:hypothetical protein